MNERPADRLAIAVAQLNPTVGDIAGNLECARKARQQAARDGADLIAFSELFIAYALFAGGRVAALRFKVNLPNYGVFDEKRVFASGPLPGPISYRGVRLGLPVCGDTWTEWGDYENVVECLSETGAELLIVPNGSPYWRDKAETRLHVSVQSVAETGLPLIYVNQIGGQDELVFDGAS